MQFLAIMLALALVGAGCMLSETVVELGLYLWAASMLFLMDWSKRPSRVVLVGVMIGVLVAPGCGLSEKAEEQVRTQRAVADGMVDTISGKLGRVPTYEELVLYVYALRFGWHALEYATGLSDVVPDREALAPPGGWPKLPEADAPVESGR